LVESLLEKAFRLAPFSSTAAIAYGLEHAPKFTISALNGLLFAAAAEHFSELESRTFQRQLTTLMADCGPWKYGPETASLSRAALERLPAATRGVTLLDPYYFDPAMTYTDDGFQEGSTHLFSYGYRLHPCGVFAMNYDPRRIDSPLLLESVLCMAYLRGTDLWGNRLLFHAMWQEGLPLGDRCAFEIPRWGILRRCIEGQGEMPILEMLKAQCELALDTGGAMQGEIEPVIRRFGGLETLPTPVELGFPNLAETIWFGSELFPKLDNFEHQLLGADFKQRGESVSVWFRAGRGELG
jgi:hypothetical protein